MTKKIKLAEMGKFSFEMEREKQIKLIFIV